jgi:LPS sulfotransferase NodH
MSIRFVIVGAPRTGSTLLVKTLNSLEGVSCHGELLGLDQVRGYEDNFDLVSASQREREARAQRLLQERNRDPVGFIRRTLTTADAAVGFKALYRALLHPRWSEVKNSLLNMPDVKFIHLTRRNSLRRYISEQIFLAGGPNHSAAGGRSDNPLKVHIEVADFLLKSLEIEADAQEISALLSNQDVLEISYEELAADTAEAVARVCRFLGLEIEQSNIAPALKKVGAANLSDSVSNYLELLDHPATRTLALTD